MNRVRFVKQVQERAGISREQAEAATAATLGTLAEHLSGGEPQNLAAQLPPELADYTRYEGEEQGQVFSIDEFFERVGEREGADVGSAAHHSRAVISVLQEAVTGGEIGDIRSQLPSEFEPLFEPTGG